jgi:2,3-bisphosphoglycerate-dependent phosphoglycerate mutase
VNSTVDTIVLIRHARSTANVDPSVYKTVADHAIPLHDPERDAAAIEAGELCAKLGLPPDAVCAWCSTYLRCQQTQTLVLRSAFGSASDEVSRRESFLLREQDFGDWDCLTDEEIRQVDPTRYEKRRRLTDTLGKFYFRYPNGESRADVAQRMAIFIGKIHRSRYRDHVIFLHGVTQRAFRMAWFNREVSWFEEEPNPDNASVLVIRRDPATLRWTEVYLTS